MIAAQLIDGAYLPRPCPELLVEDETVEVLNYDGVVIAGLGATVYAHAGVTVRPEVGSVVHLATGADIDEPLTGALERADYTITTWHPTGQGRGAADISHDAAVAPPAEKSYSKT